MKTKKDLIKDSQDLIKIQSANGNWDYDPYMHGLLNGMLLINSIFTREEYMPFEAPKRWSYTRWYEKIINRVISIKSKKVIDEN